ncbi:MAG: HAMP domain-containing histidine kinase [Erysipelotrichaceae bacterium]|nr:HAMP domain-containing histidine kinase [Erysipelotrichaceae bacterium]
MSSFRWRLLINLVLTYVLTFICYSALNIIVGCFDLFGTPTEIIYFINFIISLILFLSIFFDLMDITLNYISILSNKIQEVTKGDYSVDISIDYDDELGMLAANIIALANTLEQKEKESIILKENERLAFDSERNAEKQKNDLITNVAHDLRTPLTTIVGYLELIKNKEDLTKEEIQKYSSVAYEKSKRLQAMMDDLFEFTSLNQADIKLNKSIINISELMMQIIDEFYASFQDHHLNPIVTMSHTHLYINGDGQLIAMVFDNLISNAIKYGDDDSDIEIEVMNDEQNITIKIINYGQTINEEDLPYIFNKFYRTDSSRSSSTGGTGLGLAIAKNIVQMHGGQIFATSRYHKTTFVVIFNRLNMTNETTETQFIKVESKVYEKL